MIFNKVENSYIGLLREETDGTRLFIPEHIQNLIL